MSTHFRGIGAAVALLALSLAVAPVKAEEPIKIGFGMALTGALAGDSVMYFIGHHFGRSWLREHPFLARHLTPEREKQIEQKILQHGLKVFFLARFMLGVRAPIYITCGIMRVPFRRFLIADAISASVVVSLVFGLSYYFGEDVRDWMRNTGRAVTSIVAIVVIAIAIVMYRRYRRRHRALAARRRPAPRPLDVAGGTCGIAPSRRRLR